MSRVDDMPGYLASLVAAAVMTAVATWFGVTPLVQTEDAICSSLTQISLPAPWIFSIAGFLLLWIVSVYTTHTNRQYNIEEGTSALPSTFFIIASASVPGFLTGITPGILMAWATIISLKWMFSCIDREQRAQPLFLAGTVISFGSMTEYAFLPLAVAIAAGASSLSLFDVRSVAGYIVGLITPYILVLGFMVEAPDKLVMPIMLGLPDGIGFSTMAAAGVTALTGIFIMMRSAVTPTHRSSRGIALNRTINVVLFILILFMALDMQNFTAYIPSVALLTGFSVAGLTDDRSNNSTQSVVLWSLVVVYIILFIISIWNAPKL